MHPGANPFEPQSTDPFGPPPAPASARPSTGPFGQGAPMGPTYRAPPSPDYNTFAVLSPIFAVVVPPAGVVLGHLALPQIRPRAVSSLMPLAHARSYLAIFSSRVIFAELMSCSGGGEVV